MAPIRSAVILGDTTVLGLTRVKRAVPLTCAPERGQAFPHRADVLA
ncbi:MAG: hypothetical protein ACFCGT_21330 [Sandaracinaceae bacterium]